MPRFSANLSFLFAEHDLIARTAVAGLDARAMLIDNAAYESRAAIDGLLATGPTRTNAVDFRAILLARPKVY